MIFAKTARDQGIRGKLELLDQESPDRVGPTIRQGHIVRTSAPCIGVTCNDEALSGQSGVRQGSPQSHQALGSPRCDLARVVVKKHLNIDGRKPHLTRDLRSTYHLGVGRTDRRRERSLRSDGRTNRRGV